MTSDFLEEPRSPEYTIVTALDDSCVLFAVKEGQGNSSANNSLESTQNIITPQLYRNFYDPDRQNLDSSDI